jgi:hypothetical protein
MFLFRIPKNVGVPVTSTREILLGWQLPPGAQAEIAMRISNFIELARPVSDALLSRFVQVAREEQQQAVEQGAKSDTDPLWAAPTDLRSMVQCEVGIGHRQPRPAQRDTDHHCHRDVRNAASL